MRQGPIVRIAWACLIALGAAPGNHALAATSFNAAYISGTSGPASGGTVVSVVGNQFQSGATVTVGGLAAGVAFTNSTRLGATVPALAPGALYDVAATNPGGPTGSLPKAWFADFLDVDGVSPYHGPVETILRDGITSGCGSGSYCPSASITRAQMAVFLLRAEHGGAYTPPPATGTIFEDVHTGDFAADWIEQLYAESVTGGCATNPFRYCPSASVTRGQMAAFLLKIYHSPGSGYAPPPATGVFSDVPTSLPLAPWIEELSRLAVTAGCGGTSYCPNNSVTRGQMAVFMAKTFHRPEASRFLEQASWGPSDLVIGSVLGQGYLPWLAQQYQTPISPYPTLSLWPATIPPLCDVTCRRDNYSMYPLQTTFYVRALYGPDQLRQRVSWALHKLIVASGLSETHPSAMAPYLSLLDTNAFGSYRDILGQVTLNAAMGDFLDMATSTKNNPNENYAREIMQLFSIGTALLNQDGTVRTDAGGVPLPTYDQSVIDQFKLVYTGWSIPPTAQCDPASGAGAACRDYIAPMSYNDNKHDKSEKQLFAPNGAWGVPMTIVPENGSGDFDLGIALDAIFQHPNVGPYVARELIHSLVTSNPSPAYVERVAGFFNDDGTGTRGKLWAVVKAILLDPEARTAPGDGNYGKLKEPALFAAGLLRAMRAQSAAGGGQSDGYINPQTLAMAQDVLRPPTVFSYYPQDYLAPTDDAGTLGPEFGILDSTTALKRANFIDTIVFSTIPVSANAPTGTSIDFSELQQLAPTPGDLVERLNRLLLHGTMSDATRVSILNAVNAVAASNTKLRAEQALYLVASASQYQVQR